MDRVGRTLTLIHPYTQPANFSTAGPCLASNWLARISVTGGLQSRVRGSTPANLGLFQCRPSTLLRV